MSLNDTVDGRKSCSTWDMQNLENNGINNQPQLLRGFLPSTEFIVDIGCHNHPQPFPCLGFLTSTHGDLGMKICLFIANINKLSCKFTKKVLIFEVSEMFEKKHESNNQYKRKLRL